MTKPMVSILMVARNAAAFIDAAIVSARVQSFRDIELLVVDDGSTDSTWRLASEHAATDARVRLIEGPKRGLSAVRNAALHAALGQFAVILDSDDILHKDHVANLLASRARSGSEICASNMVAFTQDGATVNARIFASGPTWKEERQITVSEFVRRGMIGARGASLGYLKPLFDLEFMRHHALLYDERMRIGEDFDLMLRAMIAGAQYHYDPAATYYYRRHPGSTSHRLTMQDIEGLMAATREYADADAGTAQLLQQRLTNLEGARRQIAALDALRSFQVFDAARLTGTHRVATGLLCMSLCESVIKRIGLWNVLKSRPVFANDRTALMQHLETTATPLRFAS